MNMPESPCPHEPQEVEPDVEFMNALAALSPQTLISESKLAQMARRHVTGVKRAIQRGELPRPVPLFGANVWTVPPLWSISMFAWRWSGRPLRRRPVVSSTYDRDREGTTDGWGTQETAIQWEVSGLFRHDRRPAQVLCRHPLTS